MSNAMAIAAVSAVLQRVLDRATSDLTAVLGSNYSVTAKPPDQAIGDGAGDPAINLFMYRVSQNPGWANADLPERDSRGRPISNPPLALDLHYMLSAVGANDHACDVLLGHAMQALHEHRILPRDLIDQRLREANGMSGLFTRLARSGLSDQVEQIKLSPDFLDHDEISKIWTSVQAKFRPSAFYTASVVLIRAERPVRKPLPVKTVSSPVFPIRRPHIDGIMPKAGADAPLSPGDVIDIHGRRLDADDIAIRIDSTLHTGVSARDDSHIEFALPADLAPGPHNLQVVHRRELTDPETGDVLGEPRTIFESNVAPLPIRPDITSIRGSNAAVRVELTTPVQPGQRIFLTLHPESPADGEPVSFAAGAPKTASPVVLIPVSGLDSSQRYVARLQVDGVENLIEYDDSAPPPRFVGPSFEPDAANVVSSIDVTLSGATTADVVVTLRDAGGDPVGSADVELHFDGPDPALPETRTASTASDGEASFGGLPASQPGGYVARILDVRKSGVVLEPSDSELEAREQRS
jgi:hypothetical protein